MKDLGRGQTNEEVRIEKGKERKQLKKQKRGIR